MRKYFFYLAFVLLTFCNFAPIYREPGFGSGSGTNIVFNNTSTNGVVIRRGTRILFTVNGAGTNVISENEEANTIYFADDYITNNGTADDSVPIKTLILGTMTNATVNWSAKTATLSNSWDGQGSYIDIKGSNIWWKGNGQNIVITGTNNSLGAGYFNIHDTHGFIVQDMNFYAPALPTNNATPAGQIFGLTSTNDNILFINCGFWGYRFSVCGNPTGAAGADPTNVNSRVAFWNCTFNDMGNFAAGDGAGIAGSFNGLFVGGDRGTEFSNVLGLACIELYSQAGEQPDFNDVIINHIKVHDLRASGLIVVDTRISPPPIGYIDIEKVDLDGPTAGGGLYGGGIGISLNQADRVVIKDIHLAKVANNITSGFQVSGVTNLTIENFYDNSGTLTTELVGNTSGNLSFALKNCVFGGALTISAGSTGTVENCGSGSFVNNGVVIYQQTPSGSIVVSNITAGGSLTAAGPIFTGGTFTFNGALFANSIILSNSGSISAVINATNLIYLVDTSAGATSNFFKTGTLAFPIGRIITLVKTNAQSNTNTVDFGSGAVNSANSNRYIYLVSLGDTFTAKKDSATFWSVIAGNIWNNINGAPYVSGSSSGVSVLSNGTVQVTGSTNINIIGAGGLAVNVTNRGNITDITLGAGGLTNNPYNGMFTNAPVDASTMPNVTGGNTYRGELVPSTNAPGTFPHSFVTLGTPTSGGSLLATSNLVLLTANETEFLMPFFQDQDGVGGPLRLNGTLVGTTTGAIFMRPHTSGMLVFNGQRDWHWVGDQLYATNAFPPITYNQVFTNTTGRPVQIFESSLYTDSATGRPVLIFSNVTEGARLPFSAPGALTAVWTNTVDVFLDVNEQGKFYDESTGTGASVAHTSTWVPAPVGQ